MEYLPPSVENAQENDTGLLGRVKGFEEEPETVCSTMDFIGRSVIRPAVEATIRAYLQACTPKNEKFFQEKWSLCTEMDTFECDNLNNYTRELCRAMQHSTCPDIPTTTQRPSGMNLLMEDPSGILLLIGLLIIGILIGIVGTIAVCLVCPRTHRWANSKLRDTSYEEKPRESVVSDYYAAIDEKYTPTTLQLRPLQTTDSGSSVATDTSTTHLHPSASRDSSDPTYLDSDHHARTQPSRFDSAETEESNYANTDGTVMPYEHLNRHGVQNQSHKYAYVDPVSPSTGSEAEHSYFVLEQRK